MAIVPGTIEVTEGTGKKLDTAAVTVSAVAVHREIVSIGSPDAATPTQYAGVTVGGALKTDASATTQPVSGPLTDTQLRATAVNVNVASGIGITDTELRATAVPVSIATAVPITDNAGSLTVDGTVGATQSGTWTVQPGNTANTTAWKVDGSAVTQPVRQAPGTTGGCSVATGSIGATATAVKASAGQLYGLSIFNSNTSPVYMQFFNTAVGSVTLGTTAPVKSIGIPAGAALVRDIGNGIAFSTAITIAFTTTRAGATGPAATVDYNVEYV